MKLPEGSCFRCPFPLELRHCIVCWFVRPTINPVPNSEIVVTSTNLAIITLKSTVPLVDGHVFFQNLNLPSHCSVNSSVVIGDYFIIQVAGESRTKPSRIQWNDVAGFCGHCSRGYWKWAIWRWFLLTESGDFPWFFEGFCASTRGYACGVGGWLLQTCDLVPWMMYWAKEMVVFMAMVVPL